MSKASNFTDLIQRVTASCLLHPLGAVRHDSDGNDAGDEEEVYEYESDAEEAEEQEEEEVEKKNNGEKNYRVREGTKEMEMETETIMNQVFDVVSMMKKAYLSLQEAHCPWDPEKMRVADAAVLSELRKLGVLRERFRRSCGGRGRGGGASPAVATLREVVAPYEAAVEELKREVKAKELEVDNLKEKLKSVASLSDNSGKKGRSLSRRKVSCSHTQGTAS